MEKYLNGELSASESRDLLARMGDESAAPLKNELEWETTIRNGLSKDAASLPAFSTVPSAQLLTGLSSHVVTKGLLSTLGAKAGLYLGGALVVGAVAYYAPKQNSTTPAPSPTPATKSLNVPAPPTPVEQPIATTPPTISEAPAKKPATAVAKHETAQPSPKMTLDEGDGKQAPVKMKPGYDPPVK